MRDNERAQGPSGGVKTLMLDMDGTILDLAYDNFVWLERVPQAYAEAQGLSVSAARERLFGWFHELRGTLDWYCLEHWSERLSLDVIGLHRAHQAQIGYLPGAREFLESVVGGDIRVLLVTNSHRSTLELKQQATRLCDYFDAVYTAHDLGSPKEHRAFWESLSELEQFDPATTMFVDDTPAVLKSAADFGLAHVRHVVRPDTRQRRQATRQYHPVTSIADLDC